MIKNSLFVIFLASSFFGTSQKQIDDQFNSWWSYSGTHKVTDKFSVSTLYSWRRNMGVKYWQQSLVRVGGNFKITDNFTVTPGYDWVVTFPYGKQPIAVNFIEHRPFEQFTLKNKIGRIVMKHRYRLEQRFLQNVSLNSEHKKVVNGYRFRNRTRYRLTFTIPLNHKTLEDNTLFFTVFDEVFINFGKGTGKVLNQNWFNTSIGWKFNSKASIKIGYQNQYLIKGNNNVERNHTFAFGINYNLDFRK